MCKSPVEAIIMFTSMETTMPPMVMNSRLEAQKQALILAIHFHPRTILGMLFIIEMHHIYMIHLKLLELTQMAYTTYGP